jgi:hypothetical protein
VRRSNPRLRCANNRIRLNAGGQKEILFAVGGSPQRRGHRPAADATPIPTRSAAAQGFESAVPMTQDEERELRQQLARVQQEHRDLDAAISALQHSPGSDLLQVQRLKKRKLYLRDRISHLEDQLTPDIIA